MPGNGFECGEEDGVGFGGAGEVDSFGGDDFGDETAGVVAVLVVEPAVVGGFEVVVQAAFGGE